MFAMTRSWDSWPIKMDDVQPQLPDDPSNGILDLDDSPDDCQDFTSVRCFINQTSSPVSDKPKGFALAVDRPTVIAQESPTKVKIYQERFVDQHPQNASIVDAVYVRPRVRISPEFERRSSLDEIDFSGDEAEPVTPCTPPARIDKRFIDTSAPIESVRHAVSRFGGTVDWKSHKSQTFERRKNIDHELEKTQEEIPLFKQQTEAAEEAKTQVLKDLEATNQLIEEVEMNLQRAMSEEDQAKQDYEHATTKVKEMEQGIADEAREAANKELELARSKHEAAVSELKCVKEELESLQKEFSSLLNEKEVASKKAEEALSASKEVEKTVEELSKELVSMKELLESTRAAHLEAEEKRIEAALVCEKETCAWEKELKKAEEDVEKLERQIEEEKELKEKLNTASALLASLEFELAAYKESSSDGKNHNEMQAAVLKAKNELEEMKVNTEKAMDEVNRLKASSTLLKEELEKEKLNLTNLKQREGMAAVAVASLEAELEKIKSEIDSAQMREKEAKEKMVDLPKKLQVASQQADESKSAAEAAREALRKAKEEAEQAKAGAITVESRLLAAHKEIEAAKASEKLALDSIRALQKSESTQSNNESGGPVDRVTISLEEYYELSKRAQEAEEQANAKVAAALAMIEAAKQEEEKTLGKLEEANRELATRKEVYKAASSKAEKASEAKLSVEQELRNWRAEHEQRRKDADSAVNSPRKGKEGHQKRSDPDHKANVAPLRIATGSMESGRSDSDSPGLHDHGSSVESSPDMKGGKKKKKSFFPRFFMFFHKKKNSSKT